MCYQKSLLSGHYCAGSWDFSTPVPAFPDQDISLSLGTQFSIALLLSQNNH